MALSGPGRQAATWDFGKITLVAQNGSGTLAGPRPETRAEGAADRCPVEYE